MSQYLSSKGVLILPDRDAQVAAGMGTLCIYARDGKFRTMGPDGTELTFGEQESETLANFGFNSISDQLEAGRDLEVPLNGLLLRQQHRISSSGENIFFTNLDQKIDYYPVWAGIKDQSVTANQDATGLIPPFSRAYSSDLINLTPNGVTAAPSGMVPFRFSFIAIGNLASFSIQFIVEEIITPEQYIAMRIWPGVDSSGKPAFEKIAKGFTQAVDSTMKVLTSPPMDFVVGRQLFMEISKSSSRDGPWTAIQARIGTVTPATPWRLLKHRTFVDQPLVDYRRYIDGESYAIGEWLYDPITRKTFKSKVAGVQTGTFSSNSANWTEIGIIPAVLVYKGGISVADFNLLTTGTEGDFYRIGTAGTLTGGQPAVVGDQIVINKTISALITVGDFDYFPNQESGVVIPPWSAKTWNAGDIIFEGGVIYHALVTDVQITSFVANASSWSTRQIDSPDDRAIAFWDGPNSTLKTRSDATIGTAGVINAVFKPLLASNSRGTLTTSSVDGLCIQAITGSMNDFMLWANGGGRILSVPMGTNDAVFGGKLTVSEKTTIQGLLQANAGATIAGALAVTGESVFQEIFGKPLILKSFNGSDSTVLRWESSVGTPRGIIGFSSNGNPGLMLLQAVEAGSTMKLSVSGATAIDIENDQTVDIKTKLLIGSPTDTGDMLQVAGDAAFKGKASVAGPLTVFAPSGSPAIRLPSSAADRSSILKWFEFDDSTSRGFFGFGSTGSKVMTWKNDETDGTLVMQTSTGIAITVSNDKTVDISNKLTTKNFGVTLKETAVNATLGANESIIGVTDVTSAPLPRTITLKTAAMFPGKLLTISDQTGMAASNPITIKTEGMEKINRADETTLKVNDGSLLLYSNGADWFTR